MPLPQVLARPIVRRVTGTDVSVWIALRAPAEVALSVWAGPQRSVGVGAVESGAPIAASGTATTREFGAQLHVALVTAKATVARQPGSIYSYDRRIGAANLQSLGLLRDEDPDPARRLEGVDPSAPLQLALGYELDRLPTFATPAGVLADLVVAQGSCRRTNAEGPDAMAYLDDMIGEHRLDIRRRPQQLFLTGDQIYADDLAGCLLPQVNAIGRELLGFTETLPVGDTPRPVDLTQFPVGRRRRLVREIGRSSTTDGMHHLLSVGELVAMHLLVWSSRLWRPSATGVQRRPSGPASGRPAGRFRVVGAGRPCATLHGARGGRSSVG